MDKQDLKENSQNLYDTAIRILSKTRLEEVFSEIGKVEIIGSLRLNLMYRRDIDLFVISETIDKAKAVNITKKLLDSGMFRTVALADYQTVPAYDMPLGFFWELVIPEDGQEWKFDVWYLKPDERYAQLVSSSIAKFEPILAKNPKKAALILEIKEAYFDGVKYKNNVKGFDIYTAVLENGVSTLKEFSEINSH